jgi:hypothetical protein
MSECLTLDRKNLLVAGTETIPKCNMKLVTIAFTFALCSTAIAQLDNEQA